MEASDLVRTETTFYCLHFILFLKEYPSQNLQKVMVIFGALKVSHSNHDIAQAFARNTELILF